MEIRYKNSIKWCAEIVVWPCLCFSHWRSIFFFFFFWWWWIWNHAVHYTKRIDSWLCEGALLARYDSLSDNFIINYCVYRNFFLFSQIIHPRLQSQPSQCNDSWLSTIHLFKCASDFSNGIINIPTKQGKNKTDPRFSTPHKLEGGSLFLYNLQFQYALHDKINRIAFSFLRTLVIPFRSGILCRVHGIQNIPNEIEI